MTSTKKRASAKEQKGAHTYPRRKVSPDEIAKYYDVSRMTIYRLLRDGQIPGAVKVRGQWRIPIEALENTEA